MPSLSHQDAMLIYLIIPFAVGLIFCTLNITLGVILGFLFRIKWIIGKAILISFNFMYILIGPFIIFLLCQTVFIAFSMILFSVFAQAPGEIFTNSGRLMLDNLGQTALTALVICTGLGLGVLNYSRISLKLQGSAVNRVELRRQRSQHSTSDGIAKNERKFW